MELNHFPKQGDNSSLSEELELLLYFCFHSETSASASLRRAQDRKSPLPAMSLLLNIPKCWFVQGQLQGKAAREKQDWKVETGPWVP